MDLATLMQLALKASIPLIVFGLGLQAGWSDATYLFRHPARLLRAVLSMYVVMPAAIAALVAFVHPLPAVGLALLALSLSPVPPILPKKQVKAGGDTSYVGGLLVAISLLAIVVVPLGVSWLGHLFDREVSVEPAVIAKAVAMTVLVPLAVGLLVHQVAPGLAARIARPVGLIGTLLLAFAAIVLAIGAWPTMRSLMRDGTLVIIAVAVLIGLVAGHWLGGPDEGDRAALALSTSTRHPGVALAVTAAAGASAKEELAAVLLYLVVGTIVTLPYMAWRKKHQAGEAGVAHRKA